MRPVKQSLPESRELLVLIVLSLSVARPSYKLKKNSNIMFVIGLATVQKSIHTQVSQIYCKIRMTELTLLLHATVAPDDLTCKPWVPAKRVTKFRPLTDTRQLPSHAQQACEYGCGFESARAHEEGCAHGRPTDERASGGMRPPLGECTVGLQRPIAVVLRKLSYHVNC